MQPREPNSILSVTEAAEIAGCSARRMLQLLRDRVLPGAKLGKSWRIPRAELVKELGAIAMLQVALRREEQEKKRHSEMLASATRDIAKPRRRASGPSPAMPPSIIKRRHGKNRLADDPSGTE